jgi:hypothetical protein
LHQYLSGKEAKAVMICEEFIDQSSMSGAIGMDGSSHQLID